MLPPADEEEDDDIGADVEGAGRRDVEALELGAAADDVVAGALDDSFAGVLADVDAAGLDAAPAPVPCPGEDVLHAESARASSPANVTVTL